MSHIGTSFSYALLLFGVVCSAFFISSRMFEINSDIRDSYSTGWGGFVTVMLGYFCGVFGFIFLVTATSLLMPTYTDIHWATAGLIAGVLWVLAYKLITFMPNKRLAIARAKRRSERDRIDAEVEELNSKVADPLTEKYFVGTADNNRLTIFKHTKESPKDIGWTITQIHPENTK